MFVHLGLDLGHGAKFISQLVYEQNLSGFPSTTLGLRVALAVLRYDCSWKKILDSLRSG